MDEIAEAAGVGRSTLFNYFARKDDIVAALVVERREALSPVVARIMNGRRSTASALRTILDEMARWYEADREVNRSYIAALLRGGNPALPGWFDNASLFADVIARGQAIGDVRPELDANAAGLLLLDGYLGILYRWSADTYPVPDLRRAFAEMVAVVVS